MIECRPYLKQDFALYGEPLKSGEWLAAVGRGVMRQCAVAYITKWRPLADWLLFSYRFGVPGIHGETSAQKGSPEWNDFVHALQNFANDWVSATSGEPGSAKINLIEASKGAGSTLPFKDLVERSDRLYARAFRGGDLSTQSRAGADVVGANPQESEKQVVLEDGGRWATDTLNARVDEPLIAYLFNARPKAWICIRPPKCTDAVREINTLRAARDLGVPVSLETARERLELPAPEQGEELIAEAPNSKHQAPENIQMPNSENQSTNDE